MTKLLQSRVLWTATALMAIYFTLATLWDYKEVAEILNAIRFVMAALVVFAYIPVAYEAVTLPTQQMKHVHHLVLGICLSWAVQIFNSIWGVAGQYYDFEVGLRDNMITGAAAWCTIMAAVLHLRAPRAVEETNTIRGWTTVGIGMAIGIVIGIIVASAWWQQFGTKPG